MNGRFIPGIFAFSFALILISSLAFAQNIDKVIIVSDTTSADFLVAKAAAEKAGIPVLIAAGGEADEELRMQLTDTNLNPKTVILVGGPSVIKPEAERQIQNWGYTTVRLWGTERTGTSVEVAKYFWHEGAGCVAVADDTRDSDADTEPENDALAAAVQDGCPLVLVPKGTVPAELIDLLRELGAGRIHVIGEDNAARRSRLAGFEVAAKSRSSIESDILSRKAKLVIVAAPHWRDLLGTGGIPSERSVVRILNSTAKVPELAELIKARNITDVRVVGNPDLAQQIADQLNASGINVTKVSGLHRKVVLELFRQHVEKWKEKVQKEKDRQAENRDKARSVLLERVNKTEAKLLELETELEEIAASAPASASDLISRAKEDISLAKSNMANVRDRISAGQFDEARRLMHNLVSTVRKDIHLLEKLVKLEAKIAEKVRDEEQESDETERETSNRLTELDKALARMERCVGKADIEALVAKAKSLQEDMKNAQAEGNHTKAARLVVESRDVSAQAKALGDLCRKRGEISDKLQKIARERAELAERVSQAAAPARAKTEISFEEITDSPVVDKQFRIKWRVKPPIRAQATHTAVHYDYASHPGTFGLEVTPAASGYASLTQEFAKGSFGVPDSFETTIKVNRTGMLYLRAHAVIGGKNYWTEERTVEVKAQGG